MTFELRVKTSEKKLDVFDVILVTKIQVIFKMTCSTFEFSQILVNGRLIRYYLTQLILKSDSFLPKKIVSFTSMKVL